MNNDSINREEKIKSGNTSFACQTEDKGKSLYVRLYVSLYEFICRLYCLYGDLFVLYLAKRK